MSMNCEGRRIGPAIAGGPKSASSEALMCDACMGAILR